MSDHSGRRRGYRPRRGNSTTPNGPSSQLHTQHIQQTNDVSHVTTPLSTMANTPVDTPSRNTPDPSQRRASNSEVNSHLSDTRFPDLKGQVDQRILDAIPFEYMSEVQAATIPTALTGRDVLAQAKTGTGKTLAFLIPTIHRLCKNTLLGTSSGVSVLVLSPTRELALQIEKEAQMLLQHFNGAIGVQHVVGGTNIKSERTRLGRDRKDLLIATPGRLLDHLENSEDKLDLQYELRNLQTLVLDEADRMLDMGFRHDLEKIMKLLPLPGVGKFGGRQSLFFSATIPSFVHDVAKLKPDHAFISTLREEEVNTHEHVHQEYKIIPYREMIPEALQIAASEAQSTAQAHKIIAFCPTARATSLTAEVFRKCCSDSKSPFSAIGSVFEIHSRKSQAARTKTMADFKASANGILFSSDVTARGVDIPGITLVMQLGLPMNAEQYIHRLGRTARAGKEGRGVLLLDENEGWFLTSKGVKELPIQPMTDLSSAKSLGACRDAVRSALLSTDDTLKSQAYAAHLGYYKSFCKAMSWTLPRLIREANLYARHALLYQAPPTSNIDTKSVEIGWLPPPLLAKTIGMMGLKGQSGLNIVKALPGSSGGGGGGEGRESNRPTSKRQKTDRPSSWADMAANEAAPSQGKAQGGGRGGNGGRGGAKKGRGRGGRTGGS